MAEQLLGRFVINNGTYFDGYATDDEIEIYYNDTTGSITKYKNGGAITSGPSISKWHIDNGYASVSITNYEFCDSTTLITFTNIYDPESLWYPSFPYFIRRQVLNSPTCAVTPVTCDITQQGSPIVTKPTTGNFDGSISVFVSSSAVVRFQLGLPEQQSYDSMAAATSVIGSLYTKSFTGLSKGSYTIFALDANGCSLSIPVTVTEDIQNSYGTKYYFEYRDWQNVLYRCNVKKKAYSGGSTELTSSGADPVKLIWGSTSSQSKIGNILGGSMMIQLVSVTDQQWANEFNVISEKEYLVEILQGSDIIQQGYVVPEIYEEPYIEEPYPVSLRVVDGLADLSNVTYTNFQWTDVQGWQSGQRLTGISSIIDIITFCLQKTGISQPLRSYINTYADEHSSGATDDPLKQTYLNNDTFVIDDKPLSCIQVIDRILKALPQPAAIFSGGGKWHIFPIEQTSETVDYREYDTAGDYSTNGTLTSRIDVDSIVKGANVRYDSVFNEINVIEERQIQNGLLNDFIPENIQNGLPLGWTPVLNGEVGSFKMDAQNEYLEAKFGVEQNGKSYISSTAKANTYTQNDKIKIQIELNIVKRFEYNPPYVKVKFMVKAGSKYLGLDGNWYSYEIINQQLVSEYNKDQTIEIEAAFDEAASNSDIEIRLYSVSPFETDFTGGTTFTSLKNLIEARDIDNWNSNSDAIPLNYSILGSIDYSAVHGAGATNYFYFTLNPAETGNNTRDSDVTASVRTASFYEWTFTSAIGVIPPTAGSRSENIYKEGCFIKYKSFQITTEADNPTNEETKTTKLVISEENNKPLDYPVYFFDIDETVTNAKKRIINNWLLSSGEPIVLGWNNLTQSNVTSQLLVGSFLGRLFKLPTKTLTLNGRQDNVVYPYHIMRITYDDNTVLKWNRLKFDMKKIMFNGELSQIESDTAVSLKAYKDNSYSNGYI